MYEPNWMLTKCHSSKNVYLDIDNKPTKYAKMAGLKIMFLKVNDLGSFSKTGVQSTTFEAETAVG